MAFTLGNKVDDAIYFVRTTLLDHRGEAVRKQFKINNPTGEGVEDAMRAFESLTDAGVASASATIRTAVSGQNVAAANSGIDSQVAHSIVLVFERVHPLNASKKITTSFLIPAPAAAIINGVSIVVDMNAGDFASAAGKPQALGELIRFLSANLIYESVDGNTHKGGWTYQPTRSKLITDARILDGIANT
jgi:hypothetical protein